MGPEAIEEQGSKTAISLGGQRYRVLVGTGLLKQVGSCVRQHLDCKTCAVISDSNVASLFANPVKKSLASAKFRPTLITIPAGEKSKTLKQVGAICDRMIAAGLDRQSFVVGLGGGMIGDISGFVAAIYHRGIPHVQIPTTLLAMVDSSIGGKTGVDTRAGKNLIGAFHQPSLVIDDLDVLKTLPRRQFNQGFAEIIKHAIIADPKMFRTLKVVEGLRAAACATIADQAQHPDQVENCRRDKRDRTGERALLNLANGWSRDRACRKLPEISTWRSSEHWNCRRVHNLDEKSWTVGRISATQLLIFLSDSDCRRGCHEISA